jgi:hypothetical protein
VNTLAKHHEQHRQQRQRGHQVAQDQAGDRQPAALFAGAADLRQRDVPEDDAERREQ